MGHSKTRFLTATLAAAFASCAVGNAMGADLRSAPPPPVAYAPPIGQFFVNVSGLFGSYTMTNTRTDLLSVGPFGGFDARDTRFSIGNFTGGVLATFQPLTPFGVGPFFNVVTPIFQVGWFGDLNNTASSSIAGLDAGTRASGFAQVSTRSAVPIMGGISFPLTSLGIPFFPTTTVQLTAGVQITQRSASFGLLEVSAPAGFGGFTPGATRRFTTTDPAFAIGTMSQIPLDTPFGRPTLTGNFTVISSRTRTLFAQSGAFPGEQYRLNARTGTEVRATTGLGFSFGSTGPGFLAPRPVVR